MTRIYRAAGLAVATAAIVALAPVATNANTAVSPAGLGFPTQTVGTSGSPATITVTVSCTSAGFTLCMTPGTFLPMPTFGGANPSDFAQTNNCPGALASGAFPGSTATCTFNITFKPTAVGSRTATLAVGTDQSSGSIQPSPIPLSGTAVAAPPTGQRAAALARCKNKHGKKKRKKCKHKANQLTV